MFLVLGTTKNGKIGCVWRLFCLFFVCQWSLETHRCPAASLAPTRAV